MTAESKRPRRWRRTLLVAVLGTLAAASTSGQEEPVPEHHHHGAPAQEHSPAEAPVEHHHVPGTAASPGTGPPAVVEPFFDSPQMQAAREEMRREMGAQRFLFLAGDRIEWRTNEGEPVTFFEGQGRYGSDLKRIWIKTEGEYRHDSDDFEEAEIQALFSRPISPWFDLQFGLRHDFEPGPSRSFAVIGIQGLAPFWFELDGAAFLSEDGDLSARLEVEYELRLSQRLMLQPRVELDLAAQDVPELGIGSGLSNAEIGLRLSYDIRRTFAPYVGVEWVKKLGGTADFARAAGDRTGSTSAVAGVRLWY